MQNTATMPGGMMNKIIDEFKKHAKKASYHYADDSCREWKLADAEMAKALKIFDDNPSLQVEMREAASGELWRLERERPEPYNGWRLSRNKRLNN